MGGFVSVIDLKQYPSDINKKIFYCRLPRYNKKKVKFGCTGFLANYCTPVGPDHKGKRSENQSRYLYKETPDVSWSLCLLTLTLPWSQWHNVLLGPLMQFPPFKLPHHSKKTDYGLEIHLVITRCI